MVEKQEEIEERSKAKQPFDPTGGNESPADGQPEGGNGQPESRKERRARAKQEKARAKQEQAAAAEEQKPEPPRDFRRIGHKGADTIVGGNTIESFEAAVEAGADIVEFDVLRTRDGRLIVAHDYHDASRRRPLDLIDVLDAFCQPPLDQVEIDCDLKLAGREAELAGALAGHELINRAMISTMEIESLVRLRGIDPDLRLGWTYPKTRRDWTRDRWAKPVLGAGMALMRRRLPTAIIERAPQLGVEAVWAYHWLVTKEAVAAAEQVGIELFAWTVDERSRVDELAALGVHGIVSNDPRILI